MTDAGAHLQGGAAKKTASDRKLNDFLGWLLRPAWCGFDTDQELLRVVHSGQVSQTPVGRYLLRLRTSFRSCAGWTKDCSSKLTITSFFCKPALAAGLSFAT